MFRILPFCVAFCLAACSSQAGRPAPATAAGPTPATIVQPLPIVDLPASRFTLANGLTVVLHEDHKTPVVAVNVWYHVGSKDEPENRHGFAHLFEHLMFNGSQHYDDEYFRALEPAGGTDMNGTTNVDRTNYFETVPTSAFDRALWLESDRMGYLTGAITQGKLDEQRGVVLNEKRQDENRPYGKVDDVIARESYPVGHPYSWTTIGSEKDLKAATLDDVKAWFKRYYGPNNAVLAIAGDFDPATIRTKVEHYFGGLPPGPPVPHVRSWPAPMTTPKHLEITDQVPLPRSYMVWNVPGDGERDEVYLQILASVLSEGKNSRLYSRLVYHDQIASSVSASVDSNEIGGQFQIEVTAKPGGDLGAIHQAVEEELAKLLKDGPRPDELQAARIADYVGFAHGIDKVGGFSGQAGLLAANQTFHDDPEHFRVELEWQNQATPEDFRAAGTRWLGADARLTLDVLPVPALKSAATDADRSGLPALGSPPTLTLPPLQKTTLANGLKVVLAERHGAPVIDLSLLFDAGRAADGGGKSGVASLTTDMLDEGAGTLDSLGISRREGELGSFVTAATARDLSSISLFTIGSELAPALELYSTVVRQPTFPDAELARLKLRMAAGIAQEKAQAGGLARRLLSSLIYGKDHAYAFTGLGTAASVEAINRDDLVAFHTRWMRPDNATLIIVGDTTMEQIKPLLEARFGDWKAPAEPLPKKNIATVGLPAKPRVFLVDKPDAEQSLVMAANLAPPKASPEGEAMETVNTIIGGSFVSRLNMDLREDKHWSYGASSSLSDARAQQVFIASAAIERDHTVDALKEMNKDLHQFLTSQPPTGAEIDAAKRTQVMTLPGDFESTDQVAGAIQHLVEFDLPDDYWNALVPRIMAQTPQQLAAAAALMLHPDQLTWVIVGDLSKIEAPIRAAKMGEVQVLDADGNPR